VLKRLQQSYHKIQCSLKQIIQYILKPTLAMSMLVSLG